MGYCPLVAWWHPLADLHHLCLTKPFPKTPSSIQLIECYLHFASIRFCLALLFIISITRILMKKTLKGCGSRLRQSTSLFSIQSKQSIFFVVSLLSNLFGTRNLAMYLVVLCMFLVEIYRQNAELWIVYFEIWYLLLLHKVYWLQPRK